MRAVSKRVRRSRWGSAILCNARHTGLGHPLCCLIGAVGFPIALAGKDPIGIHGVRMLCTAAIVHGISWLFRRMAHLITE